MSTHAARWVKSTRCDSSHCVEVADLGPTTGLRDSKDPEVHLAFGVAGWSAFIAAVRDGEFDR
jgi:uncharacterized protein DUF397